MVADRTSSKARPAPVIRPTRKINLHSLSGVAGTSERAQTPEMPGIFTVAKVARKLTKPIRISPERGEEIVKTIRTIEDNDKIKYGERTRSVELLTIDVGSR